MDTTDLPDPSTPDRDAPYVARSPEDVLATVPLVLGFEPEDSVVMLTFGAPRPFHARIDMPLALDDVPLVSESLVAPAVLHGVRGVLLVAYHRDAHLAGAVLRTLAADFLGSDIAVLACLRAQDDRWWPVGDEHGAEELGPGAPYDATSHRFRTRAVVEGRVTLRDRAAVEASVAPAPGSPSEELVSRLRRPGRTSGEEVDRLLDELLGSGSLPDDHQLARLLAAVRQERHRDRVARRMGRDTAARHVALWSEVVRRAPQPWVADAAGVLALAAWVAGHGALAWCAVDRAFEVDPEHRLSTLVAGLLQAAVPPDEWEAWLRPLAG